MKIFVRDPMGLCNSGNIFSIEVELNNSFAQVKQIIQDKHKFPVAKQRLGLGWKKLQDEHYVKDHNLFEFSEIELRLQLYSEELEQKTDHVVKKEVVEWDEIEAKALAKFKVDLKEKKKSFEKYKIEKDECLNSISNLESKIREDSLDIANNLDKIDYIGKEMESCSMTIERKKQEVKDLEEIKRNYAREKLSLKRNVDSKRAKIKERRKEILSLNSTIEHIVVNVKDVVCKDAENKKLLEEYSGLKTFLLESIEQKEALLECPVCFNTASPPIYKCSREHLICSKCLPRMNGKCPTCRISNRGNQEPFRLAEEYYRELVELRRRFGES